MTVDYAVRAVVLINGSQISRALEPYIEQVAVDLDQQLPAMFSVTFLDPGRDILTRTGARVGAKVEVSGAGLGQDQDKPLIVGEVTAIDADYDSGGARIIVRGYDAAHRLHVGRQTRTFLDVTDSDIARKIAEEAKLEIGSIEATTQTHEHVLQGNVSDWEFLNDRARMIGFEAAVVDGKFYFRPPGESASGPGEGTFLSTDPRQLVYGKGLLEFHARMTASEQVSEVEVRGWDRETKEDISATARAGSVSAAIPAGAPPDLAEVIGGKRFVAAGVAFSSNSEAEATAKALAERIGSAHAEAEGVARGDPELRAGTAVSIAGVAEGFAGQYVLSQTRHVFDRDGYRTHFTISGRQARSLLGLVAGGSVAAAAHVGSASQASRIYGLVVAIVTANDDPEKQGRVKLKFPWLDSDAESFWAPVLQMGAGPNSGAVFLPEVNDTVVAGFELGDVRRPYVVGGLYTGHDKPRIDKKLFDNGKVRRRSIVSRRGHRLIFFDARGDSGIALISADGSMRLAMKESSGVLHIYGNPKVVVEAAKEIELKSKMNLSLKADANLDIEAKGSVKIKAGSVVDIDGSIIQLN